MLKKAFYLSAIIFIMVFQIAEAQVTVQLRQPPPNQLRATDIWNVSLTNTTRSSIVVILSGTLEEGSGGIIVDGTSKPFTLQPGTKTITYDDVKSGNVNFKSGKWREAFTRTGSAPSGDYTICIYVKNESGEELGTDCVYQTVEISGPPELISPVDGEEITPGALPTFTWLPPMPTPPGANYKIKIVEIIGNQSPEEAMLRNKAFFEKEDIRMTMFQYKPSAKNFIEGKKYAWMVSSGELKSEVRLFKKKDKDWDESISLLTPANGEQIDIELPLTFSWEPSPGSAMIYKIKIVEILGDQSPENAFKGNKPFFEKDTLKPTWFQYPQDAPKFIEGKKYAWIVSSGELKSEVRLFKKKDKDWDESISLLTPANGEQIDIELPLTFSWESSPGSAMIYKIKIVEILGDQSPKNALKGNKPFFEKDTLDPIIKMTTFQYPPSAPKFVEGKSYAWMVAAYINNEESGKSEAWKFSTDTTSGNLKSITTTASDSTAGTNNPQAPVSGCTSFATPAVVSNQTPSPKSASDFDQQFIKVGHFLMKVLSASGSSTALTGTGSIVVNWLKTPIAVEFKNIKINTTDELYSGEVISQLDQTPDTWPQQWLINGAGSFNWTTTQVKRLNNWLHNAISGYPAANKLVKDFDLNQMVQDNTNTPLKLPLGVNNAEGYTIAISEMKFEPTQAKLNCLAIFPVNEYNDSVGFKGSNIIFSTGGPSLQSAKLGLIDDVTFIGNVPNGDTYHLVFKKEQGTSDGTFIDWDCGGFRELNIDLDIKFPRSWLKPIPDNGTDKAVCNIVTNIVDWDDWIVEANLPNSTIAGTQGMELEVITFYYDHSIVRNSDSLTFPANYPPGATTGVDFTGFFIKEANIKLPDNFKTSSQNVTINIEDMIINKHGLTGKVLAKDIVTFPNGNISGLGASIDTLKLEILCSSLTSAYLRGKIVLPVSEIDTANALLFKAMFSDANNFQFTITPQGPINAKFFSDAKLVLANTSSIGLTLNNGSKFDVNLNGEFEWANINIGPVKNVKMKMDFQNVGLIYDNSSGNNNFTFNKGTWSFASPQKFLS